MGLATLSDLCIQERESLGKYPVYRLSRVIHHHLRLTNLQMMGLYNRKSMASTSLNRLLEWKDWKKTRKLA